MKRDILIGKWFRQDTNEQGEQVIEFAEMMLDGSYEFSFTVKNQSGEISSEILEYGDWGLVGDIHFTIAKGELIDGEEYAADCANEDNYHAYKVLQLDSQIFKYAHIVSGEVFILHKVTDKIAYC